MNGHITFGEKIMPYAVTLTLRPVVAPPPGALVNGAHLQAAFLNLVRSADPALSAALHEGNHLRAYALAFPFGATASGARPLTLRVACLDDRVYPALLRFALERAEDAALRFGSGEWRITQLTTTPERQPAWTGYATFDDLRRRAEAAAPKPALTLEFATPTVFTQGARGDVPVPLPDYVFGGLARRWNASPGVPFPFPDDFPTRIAAGVGVARFRGETVVADIGDGLRKTGFVGRMEYRIFDETLRAACHLLAESAFFSGVGAKTGRGLGCVRKVAAYG
jgi:CRISPR-associated endoribonuclease Cas6